MHEGRGHYLGGEGERAAWWRGGGGQGREKKNIIGLIGMWKCVYVTDLLTHV